MDLEVASEFVAMASHLVYIKARTLIAGDEEVSELEQLISSLEELKSRDRYVQIKNHDRSVCGTVQTRRRPVCQTAGISARKQSVYVYT